jgi:phage replication-related protein YjqB (UPF0714/DUF867 family)
VTQGGGFHGLAARFGEGRDFEVVVRQGTGAAVILAVHGGRIEPGTAEIARGVAGADHGLYLFKGIRPRDNAALHLASTRFDDPRALALVAGAPRVVSIHGCRGEAEFLVIGGRDWEMCARLRAALPAAGFAVKPQAPAPIRGRHRDNICNRGLGGRGIQLEISAGLRRRLLGDLKDPEPTGLLTDFCHLIREAL